MARKPALSTETLVALGAEKLAGLVLDEAMANAGFKRRVNAALAGQSGPAAIAKLIDRRLAGLERAKSFIDWDRVRAFRDDLQGLSDSIVKELCPADPALGIARLLRFIATHERVFDRVDDSSGKVQDVYWEAIEATGAAAAALSAADAAAVPEAVMAALGDTEHGYLMPVAERIVPHLPPDALASWDEDLAARIAERDAAEAGRRTAGRWFYSMAGQWRDLRQMIAAAGGDLNRLIAIELEKPEKDRRTLDIAARLLDAGRAEEALDWVRRGGLAVHFSLRDFDDGAERSPAVRQADLEARILRALGRKTEAADLLWQRFTETLSPELLRAHLKLLPDFDDMEAEEKAMAYVLQQPEAMAALDFFMAWPRHDLAARLIVERHAGWAGRDWHVLPEVADRLLHEYPLAATVLFRALLDDILGRARSKAYSHGARYLHQLDLIAQDADAARPGDIPSHAEYRERLRTSHGRKIGFWTQAGEAAPPSHATEVRGRTPRWSQEG